MPWPRGQQKGNRYVEQLLGYPGLVPGAGSIVAGAMTVPWWENGYSRAMWAFQCSPAGPGTIGALVNALDSDGAVMGQGTPFDLVEPFAVAGTGQSGWVLTFDDGPLPGNILPLVDGVLGVAVSLPLNPAWNGAAQLQISFNNGLGTTFAVTQNRFLVSSR